jgi:hypothetical protein
MNNRSVFATVLVVLLPTPVTAQGPSERIPVIDVHMHAPMDPGPIEAFQADLERDLAEAVRLNVRYAVLTGVPDILFAWHEEIGDRIGVIPSLLFPCENGVNVLWGRPCFADGADWPDLEQLRADIESGRIQALGEITTQFLGLSPSGAELEPYLAIAEEYDLPVFIHMGPGFRGGAYPGTEADLVSPNYRAALANPLLLEEALLRHPTVRVAVVHSGWPMADEMVTILYHHPQVYAEVGLLQTTDLFPRSEYHAFLQRLVRAGFGDRILFGSDASLSEGIDAILEADFLTDQEKRDILCGNAARFLRLDETTCG